MKIAIDIRILGRGEVSGIREYVFHIVDNLITSAPEHEYILFYPGLKKKPLPTSWLTHKGVSIIAPQIPNKILELSALILPNLNIIDKYVQADIFFSPHINLITTKKLPRFLTIHDLSFIHYPNFFGIKERIWHKRQNLKKQIRKADGVITGSYFTKEDIKATLGIPDQKISVVYPGVDPVFKKLPEDDFAMKKFIESHNLNYPFILALGTIEPRKNIIAVIRAFTLLKRNLKYKNLRLIIVGNQGWLHKKTLQEAENSNAKNDIIFWGKVKNEERVFLYNKAEALVYPSFFEGFGFPPLEAQASGCPVVVSNRSSLKEIIQTSGLLINPWSVHELTEALNHLINNNDVRTEYIYKGFENIKRFSWKKTSQELLLVFHNAKTNHRHSPSLSQ